MSDLIIVVSFLIFIFSLVGSLIYIVSRPQILHCRKCDTKSTYESDLRWRLRMISGKYEHDCDGKETIHNKKSNVFQGKQSNIKDFL